MKFSLKFFLIVPFFIWVFFLIKLFFNFKKFKKNNKKFNEEKRYFWVKKYSKFLSWFFSLNKKIDLSFWDDKKSISIIKTNSIYKPLIFIAKNNFDYQLPIFLLIRGDEFKNIPLYLKKMYLLINSIFIFDIKIDKKTKIDIIEKIKIPRALFVFSKTIEVKYIQELIEISKETFSKINSFVFINKKIVIKIKYEPKNIIGIDNFILSKKIEILTNENN